MSDFLGGDFSSSFHGSNGDEIDFDRAASAFPDISLDGTTEFPSAPPAAGETNSGFSFDDFDAPASQTNTAVKVTGDDEIYKFESEFPDIDVPSVSWFAPFLMFMHRRRKIYGVEISSFWFHRDGVSTVLGAVILVYRLINTYPSSRSILPRSNPHLPRHSHRSRNPLHSHRLQS
jgi:hypothetical protein